LKAAGNTSSTARAGGKMVLYISETGGMAPVSPAKKDSKGGHAILEKSIKCRRADDGEFAPDNKQMKDIV